MRSGFCCGLDGAETGVILDCFVAMAQMCAMVNSELVKNIRGLLQIYSEKYNFVLIY